MDEIDQAILLNFFFIFTSFYSQFHKNKCQWKSYVLSLRSQLLSFHRMIYYEIQKEPLQISQQMANRNNLYFFQNIQDHRASKLGGLKFGLICYRPNPHIHSLASHARKIASKTKKVGRLFLSSQKIDINLKLYFDDFIYNLNR